MQDGALKDLVIALERTKAQIRARVEHPFHVIENLFRHRKVRHKGLLKNMAQLFSLFKSAPASRKVYWLRRLSEFAQTRLRHRY